MGSSGISVGDATLTFLGDTQQLDQVFASLPGKAQAGLTPVQQELDGVSDDLKKVGDDAEENLGERVPEAAQLTRKEVAEARGEVRLLGEEFGIRLPRHVANFVAEMPGVGEALSAAFSATAVLFLVQALVQATEKVSDFAGAMLIYTAADKAAHQADVAHEQTMGKLVDAYKKAKEALDNYGKSQLEISSDKINALNASIAEQNRIIYDNTQKLGAARLGITAYSEAEKLAAQGAKEEAEANVKLLKEQLALQQKIASDQANETALKSLKEEIALREKLTDVQITYLQAVKGLSGEDADEQRYQATLKALKAQAAAEAQYGKESVDKVKEINAQIEKAEVDHALKLKQETDKAAKDLEKTYANMQKEVSKELSKGFEEVGNDLGKIGKRAEENLKQITVGLPPLVQGLLKMREAAKSAGVTLRSDLVRALNEAMLAKNDFVTTMGTKDVAQIKQFDNAIHKAQLALKHFNEDARKGKQLILEDKTAMQEFQETSLQAAQALGSGVSKAMDAMITHQGSFGKAMVKSTFEMLAQMAEKWGAYYLAKGIGDIWSGNEAMAADEIAAGTALEVLGGVLSGLGSRGGAGGNSSSSTQSQSSTVDTGGSTRSTIGVTGVQKFAMGGLISQPTLAVIGENPGESEAVLPLDNEKAMKKIGSSIASGGGGGDSHLHVNVRGGMISPDNLTKVVNQINRKVGQGRMQLRSSNTLRITKRSA